MQKPSAPALESGLEILEMLAASIEPVGFNAIAASLDVSRASVVRFLKVMKQRGYIEVDRNSGRYCLGRRVASLMPQVAMKELLAHESEAVLGSVVEDTGNSALVIYWDGYQMVCLNKKMHEASIPMQEVGTRCVDLDRYPWGWIIYSTLTGHEQLKAQDRMGDKRFFLDHYKEWIARFEKDGYCYDDQNIWRGVRRIAVPVYDQGGEIVGYLGMGANPLSLPAGKVARYSKVMKDHAHRLSSLIKLQQYPDSSYRALKARA